MQHIEKISWKDVQGRWFNNLFRKSIQRQSLSEFILHIGLKLLRAFLKLFSHSSRLKSQKSWAGVNKNFELKIPE